MKRLRAPLAWFLAATLAAPSVVGCAAPQEDDAAVATDESDLTAAELQAAIAELDRSIADLHGYIDWLGQWTAYYESQNAQKAAAITRLVADIEARKKELEAAADRKRTTGVLACLFGFCDVGLVAGVMAWQDDDRVKQLQAELAKAKAEQAANEASMQAYAAKKERLTQKLTVLQANETKLVALLGNVSAPTQLERLALRTDRMTALVENLDGQASLLEVIKADAAEIGDKLAATLAKVTIASDKADKLAQQSREETFELLKMLTAGDPSAAATKWLDRFVAKKTKELLKKIGWDPDGLIDRLVAKAFPGQESSPAAQELKKQLKKSLKGPGPGEVPVDDVPVLDEPDLDAEPH